jgi:hypothetical protein
MFRNRNKYLVLIPLLIFMNSVIGQNLDDDLLKIVKHLDTAKTVSLNTDIIVYAKKGGNKVFTANASLKRAEDVSLTSLDDMEYFSNSGYFVTIDHEEKRVSIVKNDQKKQNELLDNFDVKSLRKLIAEESDVKPKIKLISNSNNLRTYSITSVPGVDDVRIVLNMNALAIVSVTYQYSDESEYKGQYIVVNYTTFECNKEVSNSLKQSNFFTISGEKVVLNNRLKEYTLYAEL